MEQKIFYKKVGFLPCSLCSHRTANPMPKNGFAIFGLCPPTTQIHKIEREWIKGESKQKDVGNNIIKTQ